MANPAIDFETARRRSVPVNGTLVAGLLKATGRLLASFQAAAAERSAAEKTGREAAKVRALACHYRLTDRGFAADLYAAADRHEEAAQPNWLGTGAPHR